MIAPGSAIEPLPPLYAAWATEFLDGPIPRESRATCDDCAMCAHGEEPQRPEKDYFDPTIRCCSYIPTLHNFLVGRILSDTDPASAQGRASVEKRIKEGVSVTPLGLDRPPVFSLVYENSSDAFGRSRNLRCPHYIEDGAKCGIWRHRESTCATWFCKHVRGSIGYSFWHESLHQLLMIVENQLACWCVLELDLDTDTLRHLISSPRGGSRGDALLTSEAVDNRVDREAYRRAWGKWLGREDEFFIKCAGLVNPLSWNDVIAICGTEAQAYTRLTQDAYGRLTSEEIPPALKVGGMQLVQIMRDTTRVSTYSVFDPVDMPNVVMESLHHFDGRPTEDAIAAVANERGIQLDPSLVRKMVDFELLVPPER